LQDPGTLILVKKMSCLWLLGLGACFLFFLCFVLYFYVRRLPSAAAELGWENFRDVGSNDGKTLRFLFVGHWKYRDGLLSLMSVCLAVGGPILFVMVVAGVMCTPIK
jgi:hypothetical protein